MLHCGIDLPHVSDQDVRCVPIAIDAWTSTNQIAFLATVISFISDDWRFCEVLLDFTQLTGAHSGTNMAGNIFASLEEFRITDKVSRTSDDCVEGTLLNLYSTDGGHLADHILFRVPFTPCLFVWSEGDVYGLTLLSILS